VWKWDVKTDQAQKMARAKPAISEIRMQPMKRFDMPADCWTRERQAHALAPSRFFARPCRPAITIIRAWLTGVGLLMIGIAAYATDSRTSPPGWNWGSQAFTGGGPEACDGVPTSVPTVCGPYIYAAGIKAKSHSQMVTVVATAGMSNTGSSAGNLCEPWGGTVNAIILQANISSGAVISTQAGASEPPNYKTYVLWPMSLNFVLPAGQSAVIYLYGGSNGSGCGTFTFSLSSM
jgi:hypothetical protein